MRLAIAVTLLALPMCLAAQSNSPANPLHHTYRLIDIGTFGGAQSFVNEQFNGSPSLNNHGDLVGAAETLIPLNQYSNGFPCFPGPNVNHAFRYHAGEVADLGALSPASTNCSNGQSTNEIGDVAGVSENGVVDPVLGINAMHGFIFRDGELVDLGTLGGNISYGGSINTRGQVVGFTTNAIPDPYSFYYALVQGSPNGTQTRGYVWQNGGMQDLGTLGGPDGNAFFVNEGGQISGAAYTNSTPNQTTGVPTVDPFLWQNGRMLDLGTLGGAFGTPDAMNNRGQVVGPSNLAGDQTFHPFLWDGHELLDLGTLGGDNGEALAISDAGEVVGKADLPDQTHDAFLWSGGVMTDLGSFPGYPCTRANHINGQRQIVGNTSDCEHALRAVLWEHGQPGVDLNELIPPDSPLLLTDAVEINDRGEIAGAGVPAGCQPQDADTCGHAYLLIPNGDCDSNCEQRIADSERAALSAPANIKRTVPQTPAERARGTMRQRYHLPGQPAAPRG